jgi:hypothetical protein
MLPVPASDATAEAYFHAGGMAIDVAKAMLAPQIDFEQLVDPQWLTDPEHRKIAALLLKAAALQSNLALGIISGQIRIGEARLRAPPARGGSVEEFYRRYDGGSFEESER